MVSQWNKSFYSISYILWVKRGNIFHCSELFWLRMKNKTTSQLPVNWKIYICQLTHLFFFHSHLSFSSLLSSHSLPSLPSPSPQHHALLWGDEKYFGVRENPGARETSRSPWGWPQEDSLQWWKGHLNCSSPEMTTLLSSESFHPVSKWWKQIQRSTVKHWA